MDYDSPMDSDDERYIYGYGAWMSADGYDDADENNYDDYDYVYDVEDEDDYNVATPPPPPPLAPPPATLCRFYVLGKCHYGSRCTFSHTLPPTTEAQDDEEEEYDAEMIAKVAATLVDCPFFQRGNCKYGRRCRLRHAPRATATTTSRAPAAAAAAAAAPPATAGDNQQEYTCGICFEDIVVVGKHFGLLSCDHCFCLDCLRAWRKAKDMEVEVTRACPACRVPSNYIVPSLTFCTGPSKTAVVDAYKRHLAIRECRYFDGTVGSCPFGANCFYAHRDANGADVKHADQRFRNQRTSRSRSRRSSRRSRTASVGSMVSSSEAGSSSHDRGPLQLLPLPAGILNMADPYGEILRVLGLAE